jgi:hypothetical protein
MYKLQIKKTSRGKWITPKIREWGIKTPNRFKSRFTARKYYWKLAQTSHARKIYDCRIKKFTR